MNLDIKMKRILKNKIIYIFLFILLMIGIFIFNSEVIISKNDNEFLLKEPVIEEKIENQETIIKRVKVDIKGYVINPGVYEIEETAKVIDQTTPNMIQGLKGIFAIKPLISRGI